MGEDERAARARELATVCEPHVSRNPSAYGNGDDRGF